LFRKKDIPKLREFANTSEGKKIIQRLRYLLDGENGENMPRYRVEADKGLVDLEKKEVIMGGKKIESEVAITHLDDLKKVPVGTYTISHAAGYGFLYQITGDRRYADLGKKCFEWAFEGIRNADPRYSFRDPAGALRAGVTLGYYALGYDLCYDGWEEDFRKRVAEELFNYKFNQKGRPMHWEVLAKGKVGGYMPASNHYGLHIGAGLCALALYKDKYVDNKKIEDILNGNKEAIERQINEWGEYGWFPEGDGTGSMASFIVFYPLLQAWRNVMGIDFCNEKVRWMAMKWFFGTIFDKEQGIINYPKRGAYPHNVWARYGYALSGGGYFCESFGVLKNEDKEVLLWFYNNYLKDKDEKINAPYDTTTHYPHHAIISFINWPFNLKERDPNDYLPKAIYDPKCGYLGFRNRWKDKNDILITIQLIDTRGWHRAGTDSLLWIWGLNKRDTLFGVVFPRVLPLYYKFYKDGSGVVKIEDGNVFIVDFSGLSGCEGMVIFYGIKGKYKIRTASEIKLKEDERKIEFDGKEVYFKFITDNLSKIPDIKIEGNKIVVGNQRILYDEEKDIFYMDKTGELVKEYKK